MSALMTHYDRGFKAGLVVGCVMTVIIFLVTVLWVRAGGTP